MQKGFWGKLPMPFFALAPMADVTDAAFRRIVAKYGKFTRHDGTPSGGPDVMWTEFVSADGLCSRGREKLLPALWFTDAERPIVSQIFGAHPPHIREAAQFIAELGFDGVDINMGCPDRKVLKQNAGAALIKTPALAQEIIRAAQEGVASPKLLAKEGVAPIPVSVKTRTGDTTDTLEKWLPFLLETEVAAVTIHARTRKDMSKVPARWENVRRAVEIRDTLGSKTLIIGNGDVKSIEEGERRARETGCDGVMVGRAIFGNPWLFSGLVRAERGVQTENIAEARPEGDAKAGPPYVPTREEKLRVLIEHAKLFEELYLNPSTVLGSHNIKSFDVMRKHFYAYISGFKGAKELRLELMAAKNAAEVEKIMAEYISATVFL